MTVEDEGLGEGREQFARKARGVLGGLEAGPDDGEGVAPDPGDVVRGPEGPQEALGDLADQEVAAGIAQGVVDDLEAVQVEEEQGGFLPAAQGVGEDLAQPVLEEVPVRQAGQGVGAREALDGRLVLLAHDALQAGDDGRKLRAQRGAHCRRVAGVTKALEQALDLLLERAGRVCCGLIHHHVSSRRNARKRL
ncbi:hypothetical protein D3C86_1052720 [compost metagenome]